MNIITEYIIVSAETSNDLASRVRDKIQQGYQPYGSIVSSIEIEEDKYGEAFEKHVLLQAMVLGS